MEIQKIEQQDPKKLTMEQMFDKAIRENAEQQLKDLDNPFKQGSGNASQKSRDEYRAYLEKQVKIKRNEDFKESMNQLSVKLKSLQNKYKSSSEKPHDYMYDYRLAEIKRKKQAEIKKLKNELQLIDVDVQNKEGLLKEVKHEIIIRDRQLNNTEEINNFLIFTVITLIFILVLGAKQIASEKQIKTDN
ncbi:MAG: hypothetical protein KA736_01590 [Crocinitomicaceae bacterium]|nr:hypothetical protein [Crocinitomicaceae bacterium]MBP6032658.1 hypothetical protein [Crocinitomicaceae bacterium]